MALGDILLRDGTMERDVSCDRLQITRQITECDGQNGIVRKKMYAPRLQQWATAKGMDMEQDVWNATRRDVASAHAPTTPYGRWAQYTKVGRYSFLFFIRRANIRMELTSEEVREHLVLE